MGLLITDHALVRWMERTGAADVAAMKLALAKSLGGVAQAADRLAISQFLILADGLVYLVRDGALVTVMPDDGRHRHARALSKHDGAQEAE